MFVLVAFFITLAPASPQSGPLYGTAMQEFSSSDACMEARRMLATKKIESACIPK